MPRIAWVEDQDATGSLAQIFATIRASHAAGIVPDIIRTMSLRPDFLEAVLASTQLHFSNGALTRAQHEMIACHVSALNRCHY
jgi:hypothetical protein